MSEINRPTWPLGLRFVDSNKREFEVSQVFMGDVNSPFTYEVELHNGWKITSQPGEHPQSQVGFVDVKNRDQLIIESISKMDEYVKNGYLKWK